MYKSDHQTLPARGSHVNNGLLERYVDKMRNELTGNKPDRLITKLGRLWKDQPDRDLILSNIHSTQFAIEKMRMWEKNPDVYSATASNAAFAIMSRKFATPEIRLRALIEREKHIPQLLAAEDVGYVDLDCLDLHSQDGVAQRDARVGERSRVYD